MYKSLCLLSLMLFSQHLWAADMAQQTISEKKKTPFIEIADVPGLQKIVQKWNDQGLPSGKGKRKLESVIIWSSAIKYNNGEKPTLDKITHNLLFYTQPYTIARLVKNYNHNGTTISYPDRRVDSILNVPSEEKRTMKDFRPRLTQPQKRSLPKIQTPLKSPDHIFDEELKIGHTSQLIHSLQTHEQNALTQTTLFPLEIDIKNNLIKDIQRNIAVHAVRNRLLETKKIDTKILEHKINSFSPSINTDLIFVVNALIDDIKVHHGTNMSDEKAIKKLFDENNDQLKFNLIADTIKTTNKDGSEHIFNFRNLIKAYRQLPVELCAQCARNIYKGWYTSWGEPAMVTELRSINAELQTIQATDPDADSKQKILMAKALAIRTTLNHLMTDLIVALTKKDIADYVSMKNDQQCLAWSQEAIKQEEEDIASDEQKIAEQLYALTAAERTEGVSIHETIKQTVGSSKKNSTDVTLLTQRLLQRIESLTNETTTA